MALVLTLRQNNNAIIGQATWFTLAVKNTGGSAVNILSVDPVVTNSAGQIGVPYNLGGPYASPNQNTASTTSQFNVQITASATVYFTFSVAMFGPRIGGSSTTPLMQFQVLATTLDNGGTVSASPALDVVLNQPGFGQPPGSPPNVASVIGGLQFQAPANSPLSPHGL